MFGWVEFSDAERRRAAEVLNLARYPGAIDELGVGVYRDAFADGLFPATSTLHTHARYYYLVAYLMKDIERDHRGESVEQLWETMRNGEISTAKRLIAWSNNNVPDITGITGRDSIDSGWVKMSPATMDWAAIQKLGILTDPNLRLRNFFNLVAASQAKGRTKLQYNDEHEDDASHEAPSLWKVPCKSYRDWRSEPDELSLLLARDEAEDLRHRISETRFPNSLYAALLEYPDIEAIYKAASETANSADVELPFTYSFINLIDSGMLIPYIDSETFAMAEQAANLSALVSMLRIRFNVILQVRANTSTEVLDARALWAQHYRNSHSPLHRRAERFSIDETTSVLGLGINDGSLREFLKSAYEFYAKGQIDELDICIDNREYALKGGIRSKLRHAKDHADSWIGGIEMTYRLEVALMVAREIAQALSEGKDD